jgi:hypothetical protein
MSTESLLSLHDKLREDRWRDKHPFSKDIQEAASLMLNPFAYDHEVAECLRQWCMKRQPCQFGRAAASRGQIYFCVVRERDLADGDIAIKQKIANAIRHWKQRAVSNTRTPPHGLLLLCATHRLMRSAPDENLRRFSDKVLELAGWSPQRQARRGENPITSDFLYLQRPTDGEYLGFQFNVDFFSTAGDGRWWHDHRLPGGIGFTANSTGHMKAFLDWYKEKGSDHSEWVIKQAMITIAQAHATSPNTSDDENASSQVTGKLTWLRDLDANGQPLVPTISCPLNAPPKQLEGKDWTKYEGLIHTDHAVREEFFADRDAPITGSAPYLQDFTYLYDKSQSDFVMFTDGKRFTDAEVFADIGEKETWTRRTATGIAPQARSTEQTAEIQSLLSVCTKWEPSEDLLDRDLTE